MVPVHAAHNSEVVTFKGRFGRPVDHAGGVFPALGILERLPFDSLLVKFTETAALRFDER